METKKTAKKSFFGPNLKFLRSVRKLTQSRLAEDLNLSRSKIASYESSLAEPNLTALIAICTYFNVSLETMISESIYQLPSKPTNTNLLAENRKEIAEFIRNTNDASRIIDGYREWFNLLQIEEPSEDLEDIYVTLDNLLQILQIVVRNNWELIKALNISLEEE